MPTDVVKTISPNSTPVVPDYTSLQAWEDAAPADLVAADQRWIGECLDQGAFSQSNGVILTLGGSTADATRYKYLRCAAGASWKDKAGVRTTPFYPDSANGVSIVDTGGPSYGWFLNLGEAGWRMEGIQLLTSVDQICMAARGVSGANARVDKCLVMSSGIASSARSTFYNCGYLAITNCLIINTTVSGGGACTFGHAQGDMRIEGNTIIALSDHTNSTVNIYLYNGQVGTHHFGNNAFFGWNAFGDDTIFGTWRGDYNATDLSAFPANWAGTHNQVSLTFADQFVSTTNDFRPVGTGSLDLNGTPDSTYLPTDATGTTRSATTPTIGAWELASGPAVLTADTGSFTLSGQSSTLEVGHKLVATTVSYALSSSPTGLTATRRLTATPVSYVLTNPAATLALVKRLVAVTTNYSLTANPTGLSATRRLTSSPGAYSLIGVTTGLLARRQLSAGVVSYGLTGRTAGLFASRKVVSVTAHYLLTGQDITFIAPSQIVIGTSTFYAGMGAVPRILAKVTLTPRINTRIEIALNKFEGG
jgi:hypothetical protein